MPPYARAPVWLSYAAFGITFFTGSAGFALAGLSTASLIYARLAAVTAAATLAWLVPAAVGVMNAASVLGDAALPWLAGAVAQNAGRWVLLPFAIALALAQLAVWRPITGRISQDERDQHLG